MNKRLSFACYQAAEASGLRYRRVKKIAARNAELREALYDMNYDQVWEILHKATVYH